MSSCVLAQNGYPKRIVLSNGDTVNCYTNGQVVKINQMYITGKENKELFDTCVTQKARYDTAIMDLIAVKESLLKERQKSNIVISAGANIIKEQIVLSKSQKRKNKWLEIKSKFTKIVLSTVTTVSLSSTLVLGLMYFKK